ncbi:major facilitator superfamily domain-containing protein [Coniochaeta sp. 2T2.1]|nr:major facilitator superfamily domain-containing protein [Coniochaeta sp. 2T2.1]
MAGGLIEALAPTIVTETFPKRQLARAMVVYVGFLAIGAALGPIISGAIAQGLGEWRWFQRVMSIAVALNFVFSIIMLPETTHEGMEFRLEGSEVLPIDVGPGNIQDDVPLSSVPYPIEKMPVAPLTGVRAPPTAPWKMDFFIWTMIGNTFLQAVLSGFMWGLNRYDRPSWQPASSSLWHGSLAVR